MSYKQGYSSHTTSTQERRTAETHAAFLLPYIKETDNILDVGCGPGTITTGLAKYVLKGSVIGLDMSAEVLEKAETLAAQRDFPATSGRPVTFKLANILDGLPYPDETFDIMYSSQVLGHMPLPTLPRNALLEMRRVLKPGGIIASRDALASQFHPQHLNLDRLWTENLTKVFRQGAPEDLGSTSTSLPSVYRSVGFDPDGANFKISVGTMMVSDIQTRKFFANRVAGQLRPGDSFHHNWLEAGITEEEMQETREAVAKWAETDDAWYAGMQLEILAWK
ncbi:S-adenosyl-L-methionine-dependent methyltransferase [Xylariaceae sp. FL1272]|nr:S-adenosyl-L-methionine-dependent methyltransferase [Xylariaceae sp. FL1272]